MKAFGTSRLRRILSAVLAVVLALPSTVWMPRVAGAVSDPEFSHFAPEGWATLNSPSGVTVAADGSIWVADVQDHVVRKLSAEGSVQMVLGTVGVASTAQGQFQTPYSVAASPDGKLWVAEARNPGRLQAFDQVTGEFLLEVTTAGGGTALRTLVGVATDSSGNVYVVENQTSGTLTACVHVFGPEGVWARDIGYYSSVNPAADRALYRPRDVAVDSEGSVYIVDQGATTRPTYRRVQKFSSTGTLLAKSPSNIWSSYYLWGISSGPGGAIYVADGANLPAGKVHRVNNDLTGLAESWTAPYPTDVSADGNGDVISIAQVSKTLLRWRKSDSVWQAVNALDASPSGNKPGEFSAPRRLAAGASGHLYVADTGNRRVQKLESSGTPSSSVEYVSPSTGATLSPVSLALEPEGTVLVGYDEGAIVRFDADLGGAALLAEAAVGRPAGIAVTRAGSIFVADSTWNCFHEIASDGASLSRYPADDAAGTMDGDFSSPQGIGVSGDGSLWIADTNNHRLQRMSPAGEWLATVGSYGSGADQFKSPSDVIVGSDGSLWVADTGNNRIHRRTASGASSWVSPYTAVGVGVNRFSGPEGLAAGPSGEVYVADTGGSHLMRARGVIGVDTTPPGVSVTGVPDGWAQGPVPVSIVASDNGSPVPVLYSLDGSEPSIVATEVISVSQEGTVTIRYSSSDGAGNVTAGSVQVFVDSTAPVLSDDAPSEWVDHAVEISISATDALSGVDRIEYRLPSGEWTEGTTFTVDAEGSTLVDVRAWDVAGNVGTSTVEVGIDSSGVSVSDDAPEGWQSAPVTVHLTASNGAPIYWGIGAEEPVRPYDAEAGVRVEDEGVTTINYAAELVGGGLTLTRMANVTIDLSAPTVACDAPTEPVRGPRTVRFTGEDAYSGVLYTEYRMSGVGDWVVGDRVVLTSEGVNVVEYRAVDVAGHVSGVSTATVTIDNTAPDATDDAPSGWVGGVCSVTLSVVGDGSIFYSTNGTAPTLEYAAPIEVTAPGTTRIRYYARDAAGNSGPEHSAYVRIDATAPGVVTDAKASYDSSASIRITSSDFQSGVATTAYRFNDGAWTSVAASDVVAGPFSVPGTHTLDYRATDAVGNATTGSVGFEITAPIIPDLESPVTSATGIPEGWSRTSATISLEATDDVSGVASTWYSFNGDQPSEYGEPIVVDEEGVYTLEYWSEDHASPPHIEQVSTATVSLDWTGPSAPPQFGAYPVRPTSLDLSWSPSTDNVSGVDHYRVLSGGSLVATTTATTCAVTGLLPDQRVNYDVVAVDMAGNESARSSVSILTPYEESVAAMATTGSPVSCVVGVDRIKGDGEPGSAIVRFGTVSETGDVMVGRLRSLPGAAPENMRLVDSGFSVAFSGVRGGQIALVMPYDERVPASRAKQFRVKTLSGGAWADVPFAVDTVAHTVTAFPTGLGTVWVFEPATLSTTARLTTASTVVTAYGSKARITASLVDASGTALPGFRVDLYRWTGSSWARQDAMTGVSGAPGTYACDVSPYAGAKTTFRVVLASNGLYSATPATTIALPKTWVGTPVAPSVAYSTRYFTVAGFLKPRHAAGSDPVRIYRWRYENRVWKSYGYVLARAWDYSSYTKYARSVRLPYKGWWRLRSYVPADSLHAAAWSSGYDTVLVK